MLNRHGCADKKDEFNGGELLVDRDDLHRELMRLLNDLNIQMGVIHDQYEDPFKLRTQNGSYILVELLTAKANTLSALTYLARSQ